MSLSGTLAGLCVTIVAFMDATNKGKTTIVDNVLAVCAGVFMGCIYMLFWALKTGNPRRSSVLIGIADVLFLGGLTAMTVAGFIMVYTVW